MIDLVPQEEKEALTTQAVAAEPNQFVMSMDMDDWQLICASIYLIRIFVLAILYLNNVYKAVKIIFVLPSLYCHCPCGHHKPCRW